MTTSTNRDGFARFLAELEKQDLPPVDRWHPATTRDIDLEIDTNGEWLYQGTRFARSDIVKLLSGLLVREGDEYFLVSPAEKLRISVADVPFVVVDFEIDTLDGKQTVIFDTNVGFKAPLDSAHPMVMRRYPGAEGEVPYIRVRENLEARLSRSVFYRLVANCEERDADGTSSLGIMSAGVFHALANNKP